MPFDSVILTLTEYWDSVQRLLPPESGDRLSALLDRFAAPESRTAERLDAAVDLIGLLSTSPLPAGHPVRRAIAESSGTRLVATPDLRRLSQQVLWFVESRERLLAEPALSADELRSAGGDPQRAHVIRLQGTDGLRFPDFQFDGEGQPLRLVLTVNEILDADSDPWGVADWWLGGCAWLAGRVPAELLGVSPKDDELVLAAARAVADGD